MLRFVAAPSRVLYNGPCVPLTVRGRHRYLQIGRMLDIDLISPPPPPPCMYSKCGNLCGQTGRQRFIASWGLRMSHIFVPAPHAPPPQGIGQRSKVVILPTSANWTCPPAEPGRPVAAVRRTGGLSDRHPYNDHVSF
jgi:hypothetical protein